MAQPIFGPANSGSLTTAEIVRRYRLALAHDPEYPSSFPSTSAATNRERVRECKRRKRNSEQPKRSSTQKHLKEQSCTSIISPETESQDTALRSTAFDKHWRLATVQFTNEFYHNPFGHACSICDRLWFKNDLKQVRPQHAIILEPEFDRDTSNFFACSNCRQTLDRGRLPAWSITNGFSYPDKVAHLPKLDPIAIRLISPRLPFMSIRRLRRDGQYGIIGQVINVPVDVDNMVKELPRQLDDDYAINVAIKRQLFHKSTYLKGLVCKRTLKVWLEFLIDQPLYRYHEVNIDPDFLKSINDAAEPHEQDLIEDFSQESALNANEPLLARQHTLMWNEEHCVEIAPGARNRALNLLYDYHAEELSFPQIYLGVPRAYKRNVQVTDFMMSNSETRRRDRRGATPEHVLYMAMRILRIRVVEGIRSTFRQVRQTANITREMLENSEFIEECLERNLAFLQSIPNSSAYWLSRKKDVFAMIRQLGKPTAFMTLSANEIKWPNLLSILHKLGDHFKEINVNDPMHDLDWSQRSTLINEDPVTCCAYFKKMLDVIMRMLGSKCAYNPFGRYRVIDYFMRIEFQHRGSPHAHILLWLDNDPKEEVSEYMPKTVQLVTDLCSVSKSDLPEPLYNNQVHNHTFTCTKRGEALCRFNIPYWPIDRTRVLLPMAKDDGRRSSFLKLATRVRKQLDEQSFANLNSFLHHIRLEYRSYLNMIRATICRPTMIFKREPSETMTNTFNPWISSVLQSNMDLQFILDEYSCANYVVDYVNKSNRGLSNLHRELIKLRDKYPEISEDSLYRKIGSKVLNNVEMSAQEAAWYLLRLGMSHSSRDVQYIPTCHPVERTKSYKPYNELSELDPDSTDIWTKNIMQLYEERPNDLEEICLADFVASYRTSRYRDLCNPSITHSYKKREFKRIIRYREYDVADSDNFKRVMVLLFVPYRNEQVDILDRNIFLSIYDEKLEEIGLKRAEYEIVTNLEQLINELKEANEGDQFEADAQPDLSHLIRERFLEQVLIDNEEEDFRDFEFEADPNHVQSCIRRRDNIMSKEDYCAIMRTTNARQRALLLEIIHRISSRDKSPLQVFFTGPAGCGKTYVLKLIMETYNRYCNEANELNNAYIACASTGKAAVNLGGTTVHAAFHLCPSRRSGGISRDTLHRFRTSFRNVACVIIDEVSMVGSSLLHQINERMQQITGDLDAWFGAMNIIFCGDFHQLPPVKATPVYRASKNDLSGALLWQSLDYYELNEVMRQSDKEFSTILTKIGDGRALDPSEVAIIEDRFRTVQWCDSFLPGVIRLFFRNDDVNDYNNRVLEDSQIHLTKDTYSGYSSAQDLALARGKLHKLNSMETCGLPYHIKLKVGFPYMITTNIDISDGLVNGSIGTLRFIEFLPRSLAAPEDGEQQLDDGQPSVRVWIEFFPEKVGAAARRKVRSFVNRIDNVLKDTWTPISERSAKINLGGSVRCRRTQLPLAPACAITIHKSQGATFNRAVFSYDRSLTCQLVYVAMSRVVTIGGLYLTNRDGKRLFYHKTGCSAPYIKEINDEYRRLARHPLATLTNQACDFMQQLDNGLSNNEHLIIATINAQSLIAHSADIESDQIIQRAHILVLTETWMPSSMPPIRIEGFEFIISSHHLDGLTTSGSERRLAGGVAIYKNTFNCANLCLIDAHSKFLSPCATGDIVVAKFKLNGFIFDLYGIYLHPNLARSVIETNLGNVFSENNSELAVGDPPHANSNNSTDRVLFTGDFNVNVLDNRWLIDFMASNYSLIYAQSPSYTTLGCTTIDLTFFKNVTVTCMPYVAYFSYHRPLLNKIEFIVN